MKRGSPSLWSSGPGIGHLSMTSWAMPVLIISLSACAQNPIIRVQYVNVPTYIPIPATLTAPVEVNLLPGVTYVDALGSLREGLTSCDAKITAISTLKPPPTL